MVRLRFPIAAASLSALVSAVGPVAVPVAHGLAPLVRTVGLSSAALPACTTGPHPSCYSAAQLRRAYQVGSPITGPGAGARATIAILDSFGSPSIRTDLIVFDRANGIPAPPSLSVIAPAGTIPRWGTVSDMVSWGVETTLDVEMAHAIAPAAKLLVVETPVSETEGMAGLPEMIKAINYVVNHRLANIISMSWGASEPTIGASNLVALHKTLANAAAHGITLIASSGDTGATDYLANMYDLYPTRAVGWPASDPAVTAVGGTHLRLGPDGSRYLAPDVLWSDWAGASGGGASAVFARPVYQNIVARQTGTHRGLPDISMSAAVSPGGVAIYHSFPGASPGWEVVGGTSEAAPEFAGLVARAVGLRMAAGRPALGQINRWLYLMLGHLPYNGLADVVTGNNSWRLSDGRTVLGWAAKPGFDLASGIGTVNNGWVFAARLAIRPY